MSPVLPTDFWSDDDMEIMRQREKELGIEIDPDKFADIDATDFLKPSKIANEDDD